MKHRELTEKIICSSYIVYNKLGIGFLEKVYENALALELKNINLKAVQQKPIKIKYKNNIVGEYIADLVVEDKVIVELKAIKELAKIHEVQLVNYLAATDIEVGLLLNFGDEFQVKRRIFTNKK